jgi:hypothetical protein
LAYKKNVKYTIKDYVIGIIDVVKNNASWNNYNGFMKGNTLSLEGQVRVQASLGALTLRKKHYEWVKLRVYDRIYENSLKKILKKYP